MDLYTSVSYELSRVLTLRYSTSFGKSSGMFAARIRPHIFAIYGLVRVADEIVDTYQGKDTRKLLDGLEQETYKAILTGYSTNPIVHAFAQTAQKYDLSRGLIVAFFESMRVDITKKKFTQKEYEAYIYGSAEVIGLMCLKVFVEGDKRQYDELKDGAASLGSAYQKVNFLRDIAADYKERGRVYFPRVTYEAFNEETKAAIIADIKSDFKKAQPALKKLPKTARRAVGVSYQYYEALLNRLENTPAQTLKTTRVRVSDASKMLIGIRAAVGIQR